MTFMNIVTNGFGNEQLIATGGYGGQIQRFSGGGQQILFTPELLRRRRVYKEFDYVLIAPVFHSKILNRSIRANLFKDINKNYSIKARLDHKNLIDILEEL